MRKSLRKMIATSVRVSCPLAQFASSAVGSAELAQRGCDGAGVRTRAIRHLPRALTRVELLVSLPRATSFAWQVSETEFQPFFLAREHCDGGVAQHNSIRASRAVGT